MKGSFPQPPATASFPLPYSETFEPNGFSEASNFADQAGAFEIFYNASGEDGHDWTLRQVCNVHCQQCRFRMSYTAILLLRIEFGQISKRITSLPTKLPNSLS